MLPKWFRRAVKRVIRVETSFIRAAILNLLDEIKIAKMTRDSGRSFQRLKGKKGLKVELGGGRNPRSGWVNIDLAVRFPPDADPIMDSDTVIINYDLRGGLPLEEGSCDYIYSVHFFEHLEYRHGLKLMRDCYRALRPGGTFRIVLPNFRRAFEAYLRGDSKYFDLVDIREKLPEVEPGTETLVDHINYGVYQRGEHKCIYDEEKIILILQKIGYRSVALSSYQEGMDPDSPSRRRYSFYVEAVK